MPVVLDSIGADVLRDSAGFAGRDARLADRVHQRSFAVVDVAHESDDGTAKLEFLFLLNDRRRWRDDDLLDLVNAAAFFADFLLENKAVALRDLRRDVGLDRLIEVGENIDVHQLCDELMRFQSEIRGELFNDDRRLDVNDVLSACFHRFSRSRQRAAATARALGVATGAALGGGAAGSGALATTEGVSSEARIREIGGRIPFVLFLRQRLFSSAFSRSIRETFRRRVGGCRFGSDFWRRFMA